MCSVPVTLGGGSWIENEGRDSSKPALKQPRASQKGYQRDSMPRGSKLFASSMRETPLFYLTLPQRLGDRVADRVGELLAQVAQGARDRSVHFGNEVLGDALFELAGESVLHLLHHPLE